ncbi:hypothetical protein OROHE_004431 [Orobanche hederae]
MNAISNERAGIYFVYGYGGTEKTFIWRTLCAVLRCKGEIVLDVVSSGVAALLLPSGRTAHSRFGIPINVSDKSMYTITPGIELAALIMSARLIIWDESPMMNRYYFEVLDRSLKLIATYGRIILPFGGKVIVLGGDFRQILSVVPKGNREDIIYSSISSSPLWHHCKVLRLTKNMRLTVGQTMSSSRLQEIKDFLYWILKIRDGEFGEEVDGETFVDIPDDILIRDAEDHIAAIVESTYPSLISNFHASNFFEERAILAPTNSIVELLNNYVMSVILGDERIILVPTVYARLMRPL